MMNRSSSVSVGWTVTVVILAAVLVAALGVTLAVSESDAVSIERQARTAQHSIDGSIDELALQQEAVAIWDESSAHLAAPAIDMTWIHDNIGSWLHRMYGQNEVYILNGTERPIYAAVAGAMRSPKRYYEVKGDLDYLVDSVRGRSPGPNGQHDRNPNKPLEIGQTVQTTSRATHDSHLMQVGGRPAIASAMLMQPSTPGYVKPVTDWPILVSVRYLDRDFLSDLSKQQLISDPRLSPVANPRAGEIAVPLQTEWGDVISHLIWKPELPGTQIARRLIPLIVFVLTLFAAVLLYTTRNWRIALRQEATAAEKAQHLASHDPLTGLPNRRFLQAELDELTQGSHPRLPFALILVDVDDFKVANDTLGHDAGDAMLKSFAARLEEFASKGDVVARLGGDEFALLLRGAMDTERLSEVSQAIVDRMSEAVQHEGKLIDSGVSVGATMFVSQHTSSDVLKEADLALYAAKAAGRGTFRLYSPRMSSAMHLRKKMLTFAKAALDGDFVEPFYQPKADLATGRIVGFEALLRCRPLGKGLYGPHRISAAFEDTKLAAQLGDRMLSRVLSDAAKWRAAGLDFGHIAVNAAAADLRQADFGERLLQQLQDEGLRPCDLQLEVTESVLLGRTADHVKRVLEMLGREGIKIALDDFGTGFASLSHLKQFPVDIIKIDRTFVRDLLIDEQDAVIVQALTGLATALRLDVVAEGIETLDQRDFLRALGCKMGQGFLYGRPEPASRVPTILSQGSTKAAAA